VVNHDCNLISAMMKEQKKSRIAEFFVREKSNLLRYVRKWINDSVERDSEDFVQEVMLNIFERADITAPIENLSSYVYRSLSNRIIDSYRKRRRSISLDTGSADGTETLSNLLSDPRYDVHDEMEKTQLREALFSAIEILSPKERAVLLATEFEGRTFKELSTEWGVPMGTLLSQKHRAIKKIEAQLKNRITMEKE